MLERVRLFPNVRIAREHFIPTETKLDLPDVEGDVTYRGYDIHYSTAGEIIVRFDIRT